MRKQRKNIQRDGRKRPEIGAFQEKNGWILSRKKKRKKKWKLRRIWRKEKRVGWQPPEKIPKKKKIGIDNIADVKVALGNVAYAFFDENDKMLFQIQMKKENAVEFMKYITEKMLLNWNQLLNYGRLYEEK